MNKLERVYYKVKGYDCIRHPCGIGDCGILPGGNHGIGMEKWTYVVTDRKVALVLTISSGVYPETVPEESINVVGYPRAVGLGLHVGFPLVGCDKDDEHECEHVSSKICYQGIDFDGMVSYAEDFWEKHAGKDSGFNQPECLWEALKLLWIEWTPEARKRCVSCMGAGIRETNASSPAFGGFRTFEVCRRCVPG